MSSQHPQSPEQSVAVLLLSGEHLTSGSMAPAAPAHGFDIIATGSTVDGLVVQRMSSNVNVEKHNSKKKDQETSEMV